MMEKLRYGTFIFFGLFSFFGGLFIFLIPETSGLTLEEMDTVFGAGGDGLAKEDQQRQEEIYRRLGLTDRSPSPDEKGKSRNEKATEEHQEHRELSEKA
ncbi:hypothetical protein FRC18_009486 [Serendipita sp. 400]|nr:hypothetical protein FRC18_009486 [Serendipita sp. 400]